MEADGDPEVIDNLAHQHFIWSTSLLKYFARVDSRNLFVFFITETYQGFSQLLPGHPADECSMVPNMAPSGASYQAPGNGASESFTLILNASVVQVPVNNDTHHNVPLLSEVSDLESSSAGLNVPPSFILLRGPAFRTERCRGLSPSKGSLGPSNLSTAEMQVASSDLFAITVGGLGRRVLGARITIHPQRQGIGPISRLWPG